MDFAGKVLNCNYRIVKKLGEGGMGIVFSAEDINSNKTVAIKFMRPGITSLFAEDRIRFKRVIETVSRFSHASIIKIVGAGEFENTLYMIMEFLEGESLSDNLISGNKFDIKTTINIIGLMLDALAYAHDRGVIHGDIKPGNIFLKKDGTIKLLDFGVSQIMELREIRDEDEIVQTFGYKSPEAIGIMNKNIDERSDLYSIGILLYRLLTGELPFKAKQASKIIHQHAAFMPPDPRGINKTIPVVLEEMTLKLLNKEPDLRYQSTKGLLYDLERHQKGEKEFIIGEKDQKIKLTYTTRLIGREEEINKIKAGFNKAKV